MDCSIFFKEAYVLYIVITKKKVCQDTTGIYLKISTTDEQSCPYMYFFSNLIANELLI